MPRLVIVSAFNAIVSEDIAASVGEWDARSVVRVCATHAETVRELSRTPSLFALFVQGRLGELRRTELPDLVRARGGQLVWVVDSAFDPWREQGDWVRVEMPFSSDMVCAALDTVALLAGRPATGAA
jgi:hypothetical protein